ncbi:Odorant receptor 3, partial [Ephemera danica]
MMIDSPTTQRTTNYNLDIDMALAWPARILQIFGLWTENSNSRSRLICSRLLLACAMISSVITTVELIRTVQYHLLDITFVFTTTLRYLAWFYQIIIFATKRQYITKLLQECYYNIPAPIYLNRNIKKLKHNQSRILNRPLAMILITLIIITSFITSYDGDGYFSLTLLKIVVFRVLYASMHLTKLGFNLMYLAWLQTTLNVLDHINDVICTLHCKRKSLGPRKMDEKEQHQIAQTLQYAANLHQRVAKFINGFNRIYSSIMFLYIWTTHLMFAVIVLKIAKQEVLYSLTGMFVIIVSTAVSYLHTFLICLKATCIAEQSGTKIRNNLSHVAWWGWSRINLNTRNVIVTMTKHEMQIRAGSIFICSLSNFIT